MRLKVRKLFKKLVADSYFGGLLELTHISYVLLLLHMSNLCVTLPHWFGTWPRSSMGLALANGTLKHNASKLSKHLHIRACLLGILLFETHKTHSPTLEENMERPSGEREGCPAWLWLFSLSQLRHQICERRNLHGYPALADALWKEYWQAIPIQPSQGYRILHRCNWLF